MAATKQIKIAAKHPAAKANKKRPEQNGHIAPD
jgi:hypothetical protein